MRKYLLQLQFRDKVQSKWNNIVVNAASELSTSFISYKTGAKNVSDFHALQLPIVPNSDYVAK